MGERVQGWALPSILSPRDPWVLLNALVPEWLLDGILDPPGLGLRVDSWAPLVPGGITDVPSAWVHKGAEEKGQGASREKGVMEDPCKLKQFIEKRVQ